MKALVVYESMYGNTHATANAIAEGLESMGQVTVNSVADVSPGSLDQVELLVVGGPTHMHGMSRTSSRKAAVETAESDDDIVAEPDATGPGIRDWLKQLPASVGAYSAAFDTRLDKPAIVTGSAAKGIARQLRSHHYRQLAEPESFLVDDSAGPLQDGEADRARRWGITLAERCQHQQRQAAGKEQR